MKSRDIKVGAFVLASLLLIAGMVFLIGDEAQMFARHVEYQAAFKDVQGLSRGSPVRMGGVDIGRVVSLGYGKTAQDDTIYVEMSVVSQEARRIRKDSIATVEGKGLLGDKMIVITVGSQASPQLGPGEMIPTSESKDFAEIISDLKSVASGAQRVVVNLEKTSEALADGSLHTDVKEAVDHLNGILGALDKGDGYMSRLLHDKAEAERVSGTIDSLRRSGDELEKLLVSTRQVVDHVRTGPGFAHEVLYEESGSKALSQIGGAADELALALRGVREGKSFAHGMLYEEQSAQMVDNLNRASADLSQIVKDMREGKGTMGALLVDPSVYEDLKVLLGNVGRNRSLRALVRYSIRQDERLGRVDEVQEDGPKSSIAASAIGGDAPAAK